MPEETTSLLEVSHLSVRYGTHEAVKDVSFSLHEGEWMMLVGPNGAGKSTVARALAGLIPSEGSIRLGGREIRSLRPKERARGIGIQTQNHVISYPFTVREVVSLGRYAYARGTFLGRDRDGEVEVERSLMTAGLKDLAEQSILKLSGGELQRTFLAQQFAQNPAVLVLDEPTNHLDLIYQKQIFGVIEAWRRQKGKAVITVVHDLSLARAFGDSAMLLHQGRVLSQGKAEAVFQDQRLDGAYGMNVAEWMTSLLKLWENDDWTGNDRKIK